MAEALSSYFVLTAVVLIISGWHIHKSDKTAKQEHLRAERWKRRCIKQKKGECR